MRPPRSPVLVLRMETYGGRLEDELARGIRECGIDVAGRRVLLKPNFVEYDEGSVINTNPAVLHAAILAFRTLGAAEVIVAEGPGHRRDLEYLLEATSIRHAIRDTGARFADLNLAAVAPVSARAWFSSLGTLYLPEVVLGADVVVSMPKLKTHHWAGVTLSLKNMFGVMPGAVYGWPKNVLHWAGITESILDINAALTRVDRFNIVDGVIGMEGNGPIQGRPRHAGVLVLGRDPVAVDATACRIMRVVPERVNYLREAGRFLGNLEPSHVEQRGEDPAAVAVNFDLTDRFASLKAGVPSDGTAPVDLPTATDASG